jgi:hypothetical protein
MTYPRDDETGFDACDNRIASPLDRSIDAASVLLELQNVAISTHMSAFMQIVKSIPTQRTRKVNYRLFGPILAD